MDDEQFLATLPDNSPERAYHAALLTLIRAAGSRADKRVEGEAGGLGLLALIAGGRVATDKFDSDASPVGGSIEEAAVLVAHVYSEISPNPILWKSLAPARAGDTDVAAAVEAWVSKLRAVAGVTVVEYP